MKILRAVGPLLYILFLIAVAVICYRQQVAGDFDRYVYEAILRGRHQDVWKVYPIVKHSNPRAEASTVMNSPEHMGQLEPLYAIRPLYLEVVNLATVTGLSYQQAISLVSAGSLFLAGIILLVWAKRPLLCALLIASPGIVVIARAGTPDALSALFVLASCWALMENRLFAGILIVLLSIWVRTDNFLVALALFAWLATTKKLTLPQAATLSGLAVASVFWINHFAGNYGWRVLFHYSFIGNGFVADVKPHVSVRDYVSVFAHGLRDAGGQELAIFILLAIAAWLLLPESASIRRLLLPVAAAAGARFILFPSPENRYFAWAYLVVGVVFIQAVAKGTNRGELADTMEPARAL